jgi:hypothetical protein
MSKTSLKELLQIMQNQNVKENLPDPRGDWEILTPGPMNWDAKHLGRKIERMDKHFNDPSYPLRGDEHSGFGLDPVEDMQPQHMVSPKQNMWLELLSKENK